jgi:hypothetical protein
MIFFVAAAKDLYRFLRMAKRAPNKIEIKAVSLRLSKPAYAKVAAASATLQISISSVLRLAVDRGIDRVLNQLTIK